MFFLTTEDACNLFRHKFYIFTAKIHRFSLQKESRYRKSTRRYMLVAVWAYALVLHITRALIGWKIANHSLGKKISIFWRQKSFFAVFSMMDNFVEVKPKKKPCNITAKERAKQYPWKFFAKKYCAILRNSHNLRFLAHNLPKNSA